tara:strand:- start:1708 stop:1974 length:267 start_codon:yes stop_codon:yes gene_type:complete
MSVYLPLDEKLDVSHIEEMFLKNKYFEKLCCEELKLDINLDDISSYVVDLDRKIIEELWDMSLDDRYEARDYIIDNWDGSRYTNRNKD